MAVAKITTRTVPVTTFKDEDIVTLELTRREAQLLRTLAYKTGGSSLGPRGIFDRIGNAIAEVGIRPTVAFSPRDGFREGILTSIWLWPDEAEYDPDLWDSSWGPEEQD